MTEGPSKIPPITSLMRLTKLGEEVQQVTKMMIIPAYDGGD
jgi:hypothetical protein